MKNKKILLLLAILCSTFTMIAIGNNTKPYAENKNMTTGNEHLKAEDISNLAIFVSQQNLKKANKPQKSKTTKREQNNIQYFTVEIWDGKTAITPSTEGDSYDEATSCITFKGSDKATGHIFMATASDGSSEWKVVKDKTYNFSGTLKADNAATVHPCILCIDGDENLYLANSTLVTLDKNNGYTSTFEISAEDIPQNTQLKIAFVVEKSTSTTTITSTDNKFGYSYTSVVAQEWSPETHIQGIDSTFTKYTILLEDGITTIGLSSDGTMVTGINSTATEIKFPKHITIDSTIVQINTIGQPYNKWSQYFIFNDWSGVPNLKKLDIHTAGLVNIDFENSSITDLYVGKNYFDIVENSSNIYLHIPYSLGTVRSDLEYDFEYNSSIDGFKRILVGDEQPEYPSPAYSDWIMAGENEGEYYGISYYNKRYCIREIFTDKDSVSLPIATPVSGGCSYIRCVGKDSEFDYSSDRGALCKKARNLKTLSIPDYYSHTDIEWSYSPIKNLYLRYTTTYYDAAPDMTIYPYDQADYSRFVNEPGWNSATIVQYGWEEWMTVDVKRKGEFAQTYIEMTNANWDLNLYVKITGTLNETDLKNISKLSRLIKLDLSEATFTSLPEDFLNSEPHLLEVILPTTLTTIPYQAFENCKKLIKVTAPGVKTIESDAFNGCSMLETLNLENVTNIGGYAFSNCTSFNPTKFSSELNSIGSYAFSCTGIKELILPQGVETISSYAFNNCDELEKVELPNTIKTIESSAFYDCDKLEKVELPNTIKTIESSAFYSCNKLAEINFPEGLSSIGNDAFLCCKISEIELPSTLYSIGDGAFEYCWALKTIKCKAAMPPTANGEFTYDIDMNHCTLYVPPFSIDAYRADNYWKAFYIMKPLDEPVKNIYIDRAISLDLLSEDNDVLKGNPNIKLDYYKGSNVGQLTSNGDGTLSAGVFSLYHSFKRRDYSSTGDYRTTLINNAENMRADSVVCTITFEKDYWHFITFQYDVKMEDIYGVNNTDFVIRKYNGASRASGETSNWEKVPADGVLEAGKGYIIQAANNSTYKVYKEDYWEWWTYTYDAVVRFPSRNTVTKNNMFTSNNIIVPLEEHPAEFAHNRSWNLVGNPYPCYYDMDYLMDEFTAPITLWRGTSYRAYSPIDDDIMLRPNEAFFVQRPLDAEQMVFDAKGRRHYDSGYNSSKIRPVEKSHAKANANRSVFNINIDGCDSNDRTRIVMNEKASMDYEISRDANKFFAEVSTGAEIYVDGEIKYDICERPLADGTATIGTRIAKEGEYTISLSGRSIDGWNVILTDTNNGATVDLTQESYTFRAEKGMTANRFLLTFKNSGYTSIDDTSEADKENNVRILNTSGVTVYEGNIEEFKKSANAGVYIVTGTNKSYKIVIK